MLMKKRSGPSWRRDANFVSTCLACAGASSSFYLAPSPISRDASPAAFHRRGHFHFTVSNLRCMGRDPIMTRERKSLDSLPRHSQYRCKYSVLSLEFNLDSIDDV
ncbi:hypothetical protein BO99DRAFT_189904 [Aspergillus violaceofuscus CBS 115571]|uniref:Uncharacterized protein n=1 Tax=Aspergillus violaceofuscus (strain CBS 115571) TaxID=1450538 RepID=A0A2V5H9N8_ASPV1|nr:hypothetical protein BO99DRAFT_189904 [Aspergillus violaceofuscus CBS 115571]